MSGTRFCSASRSSSSSKGKKRVPGPEILTLRLGSEMVYVHPPSNFEEALVSAQSAFPQLACVPHERLAFSIAVRIGDSSSSSGSGGSPRRIVRITPPVWSGIIQTLQTYEVVDVSVLPLAAASRAARSDTDVRSSPSFSDVLDYKGSNGFLEPPPQYTGSYNLCDTDKSPAYSLQPPESSGGAGPIKRSSSALGWLGRSRR